MLRKEGIEAKIPDNSRDRYLPLCVLHIPTKEPKKMSKNKQPDLMKQCRISQDNWMKVTAMLTRHTRVTSIAKFAFPALLVCESKLDRARRSEMFKERSLTAREVAQIWQDSDANTTAHRPKLERCELSVSQYTSMQSAEARLTTSRGVA